MQNAADDDEEPQRSLLEGVCPLCLCARSSTQSAALVAGLTYNWAPAVRRRGTFVRRCFVLHSTPRVPAEARTEEERRIFALCSAPLREAAPHKRRGGSFVPQGRSLAQDRATTGPTMGAMLGIILDRPTQPLVLYAEFLDGDRC